MNKRHLAYLLATTLLAAPAVAQTSSSPDAQPRTPPATSAQPPATTGPQTTGEQPRTGAQTTTGGQTTTGPQTTTGAQPGTDAQTTRAQAPRTGQAMAPLAAPGPEQMMASDVRGTRVYGANNENIGDISDILIDREGRVVALVVGVGGFLGIGQKDVAIPFQAFNFVAEERTAGKARAPATTGTTAKTQTGTIRPERIVLQGMNRADLDAAPEFRPRADVRGTGGGPNTNR